VKFICAGSVPVAMLSAVLAFMSFLKVENWLLSGWPGAGLGTALQLTGLVVELTVAWLLVAGWNRMSTLWACLVVGLALGALHLLVPTAACGCMGKLSRYAFSEVMAACVVGCLAAWALVADERLPASRRSCV